MPPRNADRSGRLPAQRRCAEVSAPHILLMFFDPECADCRLTKARLSADYSVNWLCAKGVLKIVAIYPGEDCDKWRAEALDMPDTWVKGSCEDADTMFAMPEMPMLYYLDKEHVIRAKQVRTDNALSVYMSMKYKFRRDTQYDTITIGREIAPGSKIVLTVEFVESAMNKCNITVDINGENIYTYNIMITTPEGVDILCRQIAGAVARRIVTYAKEGEECYIDEHLGFIKLGSRVDVYLPIGTEVCVKMGQSTTGDQTVIAKLK